MSRQLMENKSVIRLKSIHYHNCIIWRWNRRRLQNFKCLTHKPITSWLQKPNNKLTVKLTIAKPDSSADVLDDAFNLLLLRCSRRQLRAFRLLAFLCIVFAFDESESERDEMRSILLCNEWEMIKENWWIVSLINSSFFRLREWNSVV